MKHIPSTPGLASLTWSHEATVGETTSPYTLERKTYDYGAQRLRAVCVTPSMSRENAATWMGFFARIRQTEEPVLFGPRALQNAEFEGKGHSPGNPRLASTAIAGNTLSITNLITTEEQLFPAGWFFSMENEDGDDDLYMIAEPMRSVMGSADAEMHIFPSLRGSYSQDKWLHFNTPQGQFHIINHPSFAFTADNLLAPITFELAQK